MFAPGHVKTPPPTTGRAVTIWGMAVNLALAGAKIAAGVVFSCQTILADGVHSLTDLVSDLAVLASLKWGNRPADPCHPYGHRRVHTLVAMFVGIALFGAAAMIGYRAVASLSSATVGAITGPVPLAMAMLTVPVKEWLFRVTRRAGHQANNPAVLANAWHHRSDAFTSLGASAGIAGAMFGGEKWQMLDGLTAAVLAAFLLVAAIKIIISACNELTDRAPAKAQVARLGKVIQQTQGVQNYHAVRARKLGGKVEMDLHILVDPNLTVEAGHNIASAVRQRILAADNSVQQVIVHIEPNANDE
ncbi:MAG: cation-efflux pump [Planctomycetota bacterium]|nr:MAG: cation-efflux pump [Planctomycetota bacterium]